MRSAKQHFKPFGKSAVAVLLIGMILLLDAMAACPALHELIHKDADKPGHECAVTMFAHGKRGIGDRGNSRHSSDGFD